MNTAHRSRLARIDARLKQDADNRPSHGSADPWDGELLRLTEIPAGQRTEAETARLDDMIDFAAAFAGELAGGSAEDRGPALTAYPSVALSDHPGKPLGWPDDWRAEGWFASDASRSASVEFDG